MNSTAPTLILQGAYDKPTPIYINAPPESAKFTFLYPKKATGLGSQLAASNISDYFENPADDRDSSCLDARRPKWAMPANYTREVSCPPEIMGAVEVKSAGREIKTNGFAMIIGIFVVSAAVSMY